MGLRASDRIERLARSMPAYSPLRDLTVAVQAGAALEARAAEVACEALRRSGWANWAERSAAAWILARRDLPLDLREQAGAQLRSLVAESKPADLHSNALARTLTTAAALGGVLASLVAILGAWHMGWAVLESLGGLFWLYIVSTTVLTFVLAPLVWPLSVAADLQRHNAMRADAAAALGRLMQAESLAPLLRALRSADSRLHASAREALLRVLGVVTEAHRGTLESAVVPELCDVLADSGDELGCAILAALERVGDGRAVYTVRQVARRGRTPLLRQGAAAVLPILVARAENERSARCLLRASQVPAGADALLRPAPAAPDADPAVLLRPPGDMESAA